MTAPERPRREAILITPDMLAEPPEDPRGGRIDFERGMTYAPPLTLALLALLFLAFYWQLASGSLESVEAVIASGALVRDRVLAGEVWRMLTATALHGDWGHLIGNGVSLYTLGIACEHAFGWRGFGVIYLASGLGGSAMSLAMSPGPSLGASGSIFGMMGAVIAYLIRHQDRFYVRDKRIGIVLLVWGGFSMISGLTSPFIDNGAHLGGLIAGVFAGLLAPSPLLKKAPSPGAGSPHRAED